MKRRVSRSPWRSQRQPAGGEGPGVALHRAWASTDARHGEDTPTDEQSRMFMYAKRFALSRRDVCVCRGSYEHPVVLVCAR
jgi:hypothetical protein